MKIKVYVFGNEDLGFDNAAISAAKYLQTLFSQVEFIFIKPNQDLPFSDEEEVYILDVVEGLKKPLFIDIEDFDKLKLSPRTTVHDFDLGFQLKYLKKLGKIKKARVLGLPMTESWDYRSIHSIFRKLVAQDIQGS